MTKSIMVTKEGYSRLLQRKTELFEQLKEIQGKKSEAAEVGGNVWHDNFSFEDLCRQEMMINKRIADLNEQINHAKMIEHPTSNEFLQIGHIAVLLLDDEERQYEIAGFGENDLNANPPRVEYLAPIVRDFVGKEIGATANVKIGEKTRRITLVEILRKEA